MKKGTLVNIKNFGHVTSGIITKWSNKIDVEYGTCDSMCYVESNGTIYKVFKEDCTEIKKISKDNIKVEMLLNKKEIKKQLNELIGRNEYTLKVGNYNCDEDGSFSSDLEIQICNEDGEYIECIIVEAHKIIEPKESMFWDYCDYFNAKLQKKKEKLNKWLLDNYYTSEVIEGYTC